MSQHPPSGTICQMTYVSIYLPVWIQASRKNIYLHQVVNGYAKLAIYTFIDSFNTVILPWHELAPLPAKHDYGRFSPIKSLLMGMKHVIKHLNLEMFGLKLNKYE